MQDTHYINNQQFDTWRTALKYLNSRGNQHPHFFERKGRGGQRRRQHSTKAKKYGDKQAWKDETLKVILVFYQVGITCFSMHSVLDSRQRQGWWFFLKAFFFSPLSSCAVSFWCPLFFLSIESKRPVG